MKKTIVAFLTAALLSLAVQAQSFSQTNIGNTLVITNTTPSLTLDTKTTSGKTSGSWEMTLGGAGTTTKGESAFGFDVSLSTNPFKKAPNIWVGLAQGLYWEPSFSGSTDVFVDWNWRLYKDVLYLNTGWSGGALYGQGPANWRTGPEATCQYYTSDKAFIYAGVNYDFMEKGPNTLRYCFGIGLVF